MPLMKMNRRNLKILKRKTKNAKEEKKETFMFEGQEMLVRYSEYLIEYLERNLRKE